MSLLRLLTVGRSLGTIRDQPSRYKMTEQALLPKFGATKQSEIVESPRAEMNLKAASAPSVEEKAIQKTAVEPAAAKEKGTKIMTAVETGFPAVNTAAAAEPKQAFPQGRWTIFRNPFGGALAKSKAAQAPVQGELSLDAVKPVRNDLRDSDLEVIRVSRPAPVEPVAVTSVVLAPPAASTAPPESVGPAWDRLKTQFFGAGKT